MKRIECPSVPRVDGDELRARADSAIAQGVPFVPVDAQQLRALIRERDDAIRLLAKTGWFSYSRCAWCGSPDCRRNRTLCQDRHRARELTKETP